MTAHHFGFHMIIIAIGTAICLAPSGVGETPAKELGESERNASLELLDLYPSKIGRQDIARRQSVFQRNKVKRNNNLPENEKFFHFMSYENGAKLFSSFLRKPKLDMMLNMRGHHTLSKFIYLRNIDKDYLCASHEEPGIYVMKVVADVIKSVVMTNLHLVLETIPGACFLETLWYQWIAFEVLTEEVWWSQIHRLTYLSHSQHILVGSLDWIAATMEKVKHLYNKSKINAMNTKWIWFPQVTNSSQREMKLLNITDIIDKMQDTIIEGIRGVLIFEESKKNNNLTLPETSQGKIGSIRAPGDGSWFLDIARTWQSGIYKIFHPLWPIPPLNFQNRTIRITCLQKPQVFEFKVGGKLHETTGYVSELLLIAQHYLNFTEILVPSDGFGLKESNGSWNGMVGVLHRKEADIAPLDFSPSLSRSEVVDFGLSIGEDVVIILSRAPTIIFKPFLLLQIFSLEVMASIVACALVLAVTLRIMITIESTFDHSFVQIPYLPHLIANCLKIFVYQGSNGRDWPCGNAGRIVTISGCLIAIVVASLYSGSVTALFAIPFKSKPIDSAEDLLASKIRPALRAKTIFYQSLLEENGILYSARDRAEGFAGEVISSWDFLKTVADGTYALVGQ